MIKIIKLLTGEELIGDLKIDDSLNTVVIDRPCYIQLVPSKSNPQEPAMALVPYAAYTANHNIVVKQSAIVWEAEPLKELYNRYNSIFGSGLVVPS